MRPRLYFVALVPGEPVESDVQHFKTDLHERFGTKAALKSPCHITLLPPFRFQTANENLLKEALQRSAQNSFPFEVELLNFGSFIPRVIYVQVVKSNSLDALYQRTKLEFDAVEGMKIKTEMHPYHPHMTIGNRDWAEGGFQNGWEEYKTKKYSATFIANKITLLRHENLKWETAGESSFAE